MVERKQVSKRKEDEVRKEKRMKIITGKNKKERYIKARKEVHNKRIKRERQTERKKERFELK